MAFYHKLASLVYNNIFISLRVLEKDPFITLEQIEDRCILERLQIIKEYVLKGIINRKELLMSYNCVPVDCASIEKCDMCQYLESNNQTLMAHFTIPQILVDYGIAWIEYIGTTDKMLHYPVYTSPIQFKFNKYRKVSKKKPFVYIDITPNKDGLFDCYIFNAPLIKEVTVIGVFKDPRQLEELNGCCVDEDLLNLSIIDNEVAKRVTEEYIRYYRQTLTPIVKTV